MTMRIALSAFALLGLLAGCGADGAPKPPPPPQKTGVTISGDAEVGVTAEL